MRLTMTISTKYSRILLQKIPGQSKAPVSFKQLGRNLANRDKIEESNQKAQKVIWPLVQINTSKLSQCTKGMLLLREKWEEERGL